MNHNPESLIELRNKIEARVVSVLENFTCEICGGEDFLFSTCEVPFKVKAHCENCGNIKNFDPLCLLKDKNHEN